MSGVNLIVDVRIVSSRNSEIVEIRFPVRDNFTKKWAFCMFRSLLCVEGKDECTEIAKQALFGIWQGEIQCTQQIKNRPLRMNLGFV